MPILRSKLYRLTDGDKAIFARYAKTKDPNWITNYYLRNADTGTWWRTVPQEQIDDLVIPEFKEMALKKKTGYENLYTIWEDLGKPDYFGPELNSSGNWMVLPEGLFEKRREELMRCYQVRYEPASVDPIFQHPHGLRFFDWQSLMHQNMNPLQVIIGGFGSSKTFGKVMSMLVNAITLPGYRAFALAPMLDQAEEVQKIATQMIDGTLFERFLINAPSRPPRIFLGNDMVGQTVIECHPIKDNTKKIRTLTGDEALVDQAEDLEDIDGLIRDVGTRFRGQYRGRPRVGRITLLANSEDNPQLWDWFDTKDTKPKFTWGYAPATYENLGLTIADLIRYQGQVGDDEVSRGQYIKGHRPMGNGEHFSQKALKECHAEDLDIRMRDALAAERPGWIKREADKCAVYNWEMPYEKGHDYIVCADTGWSNPPNRNSACVAVWDVTHFPKIPAQLVAFHWVFGNNSPIPWMQVYTSYVTDYHALGSNGYDATGPGAGYDQMTDIGELMPYPVQMTGNKKYIYLNLAKKFVANAKLRIPNIVHLFSQCSRYKLPDEGLRQDIVMMLLVTAAMLNDLYYVSEEDEDHEERVYEPEDRYGREESDRDTVLHTER